MTLADLARDLSLTKARITQLRDQGLVVQRRDGRVNERATLERLYMYWLPRHSWWNKPVGLLGLRLRKRWRQDEQRIGLPLKDLWS